MKIFNFFFIFLLTLISACSTTKSYPPKFYGYTPTEQNFIKSGQIAVGFDEDQVRMAWGNPNNIENTRDTFIWTYKERKRRYSPIQQVTNSIARGQDPLITATSNPSYNTLFRKVVFDNETRKVIEFQSP